MPSGIDKPTDSMRLIHNATHAEAVLLIGDEVGYTAIYLG
jgi:hypothetical protein